MFIQDIVIITANRLKLNCQTERCWSGLTGTPGERVSGFPRPWVRIPPSPPTKTAGRCSKTIQSPDSSNPTKSSISLGAEMAPPSWQEGNAWLDRSKHKRLQKVMVLYRLIWVRDGTLLAVADLESFLPRS